MESSGSRFDPQSLLKSLVLRFPRPLQQWGPLILVALVVAIVILIIVGVAPYLVIGLALAYQWYKRKQNVNPPYGVSPSPVAQQRRRTARIVAFGAIIFAFSPLIVAAIFPLSEEATREGSDMRPIQTLVTLPVGVVIAMTSLSLGNKG